MYEDATRNHALIVGKSGIDAFDAGVHDVSYSAGPTVAIDGKAVRRVVLPHHEHDLGQKGQDTTVKAARQARFRRSSKIAEVSSFGKGLAASAAGPVSASLSSDSVIAATVNGPESRATRRGLKSIAWSTKSLRSATTTRAAACPPGIA